MTDRAMDLQEVAQCKEFKCITSVVGDISTETKRVRLFDSVYEITDAQTK